MVRSGLGSSLDSRKAPHVVSGLPKKVHPDHATNRHRTALDGFRGLDNTVQTYAEGLRIGVGDALNPQIRAIYNVSE